MQILLRLFKSVQPNCVTMPHKCHFNPAADRNKEHILQVLKKYIPSSADASSPLRCLEISSGSGQHVAHFAKDFPAVTFQPSEYDTSMFDSIRSYVADSRLGNVNPPVYIDVREAAGSWNAPDFNKPSSLDFVININMMHISPFQCSRGLFKNAGDILRTGGLLFTYGPYGFNGTITPESNIRFDAGLRAQNPEWGIRDVGNMLVPLAASAGLRLVETVAMPANNHTLIWKKE